MSNIISSLGGGSGVDTTSLVSSLVAAERAPQENRLDSRQEKLEAQISAYGTLKSALSEFQGVLSPLANSDTFNARSVAFPETDIITPNSLDPGAQTGSYQIEVLDVASAQTLVMGANSDQKAALGASGELNIQFGAWTYTGTDPTGFAVNDGKAALNITIEASDSLKTIADKINETDSGIQASVMKVDDQYQLMLTAPSGEDNALQITGDDPSLSGFEFNSGNFASVTETQQASDARLKVNGLEVRRQTNEIDDVITGFNFTLNKEAEGEKLNFSVDADTAVAEQAVRDFVEAYNSLYETTKNLTGYSKDEDNNTVRGDLATDGTAKALIRQLRNMVGTQVPGVESGFTALTNVGIRTELDGTLSIEEDEFSAAISQNFEEVANLFAQNTSSGNNYVDVGTGTRITGTKAGNYNVEITQDPSKGFVTGNAIVGTLFDTPLDTSAGDYSFQISVNGTKSDTITLSGTYNSADEVRAELQSLINGDAKLKAVNSAVDVSYDSDTGTFSFTSREYGSSSKVSFSSVGADMANLGVTDALTGTVGKDVVGTINGKAGFGAGEVLLPDLESDAYGLNLSIRPGAAAEGAFQINFSRGMGGELTRLIDRFLASDGVIATREDNIDNQLDGIQDDREELDRKIAIYEERLTAQFLAMEQVVSSLNATGDSLDGILDRLPWTAQNG
ncbi:MAG: flagellar hook protein [Oceanospirillaceae bacterium]|nr:flagellar hook protein [Oceanospirillaceae bacterium]